MKKIINYLPFFIVIVAGILASRTLLFQKGYFNMHDDLQMMRQLSMEKCFLDGQIPCRWIADMGYGFGFPLFNFYPPLPYLVGEIFRLVGFSFVNTAKIVFALSIILSGIGMYFLGKEIFKNKWSGFLSAIFYIWAPYHSVDVYVRGAMNEAWALVFFPLIFLFGYKIITEDKKRNNIILLALSYSGLFLSHNLMVLIFTPFFIIWCLGWLYLNKWKNLFLQIKSLMISGLLSLGLSAFFTFPAIFENKFTWLKSQLVGYYNYTVHFVNLDQLLITRFWGYGPSVWLETDGMPFQIGHLHWILSLIILFLALFLFFRKKIAGKAWQNKNFVNRKLLFIILFLFLMGWTSAFMTHVRSSFVYDLFPFLGLVQFPWRFLTLVIFAFSLLVGFLILAFEKLSPKYLVPGVAIVTLAVVALNWNYFLPEKGKMGSLTDQEKFSGLAWELQQTSGIYDYLPSTAQEAPKAAWKVLAEVMDLNTGESLDNQSVLSDMNQGTDWARFSINSSQSSVVRINILDFPGWNIYVDGEKITKYIPENEKWGRMWINLPSGKHQIEARFENTPVRTISNAMSLLSLLGLLTYLMLQFRRGGRN